MQKKGIYSILVGVSFEDSQKALNMALKNNNLYASLGIHPTEKESFDWEKFQDLFDKSQKKVVAVGECGLDYYWLNKDLEKKKINLEEVEREKERQRELFKTQINFALKNDLPLILHIRSFKDGDAHKDALEILDLKEKEVKRKIKADFHFFTEGPEIAREIIEKGYMISLPGVITFASLDESIKNIPLENLMVETDSPFAAPAPFRGKVNTPLYLEEIIKKVSEVKGVSEEEIRLKTVENSLEFFKI